MNITNNNYLIIVICSHDMKYIILITIHLRRSQIFLLFYLRICHTVDPEAFHQQQNI